MCWHTNVIGSSWLGGFRFQNKQINTLWKYNILTMLWVVANSWQIMVGMWLICYKWIFLHILCIATGHHRHKLLSPNWNWGIDVTWSVKWLVDDLPMRMYTDRFVNSYMYTYFNLVVVHFCFNSYQTCLLPILVHVVLKCAYMQI